MDDDRWVLNEEDRESAGTEADDAGSATSPADFLAGHDSDGVVTVSVTTDADVVSVGLGPAWKDTVTPERLHRNVLDAANAATAQALAHRIETVGHPGRPSGEEPFPQASGEKTVDDTPLSNESLHQLLDAVTGDLERFVHRLSAHLDSATGVTSSGGHVTGSGRRGQITEMTIDPRWAGTARQSEIEAELTDVLSRIKRADAPGELGHGPSSTNISELHALVSDPRQFLHKIGLTPPQSTYQDGTPTP